MKIVFIGDIHYGKTRESTTNPGAIRQANDKALITLRQVVAKINNIKPDLVVQMGDLIREIHEKEVDKHNYHDVMGELKNVNAQVINILGNHDARAFDKAELEALLMVNGSNMPFFGVMDFAQLQIAWLDLSMAEHGRAYITNESLEILSNLDPFKKILICSHYSLCWWDSKNNFYTKDNPNWMTYENASEAMEILNGKNVIACISGHAHWGGCKIQNKIKFITNPSLTENIAAENFPENNPGVYSILETEYDKACFKSFSGEWAFLNFEF